ncbi:unnamed protein product [Caretta caretta]
MCRCRVPQCCMVPGTSGVMQNGTETSIGACSLIGTGSLIWISMVTSGEIGAGIGSRLSVALTGTGSGAGSPIGTGRTAIRISVSWSGVASTTGAENEIGAGTASDAMKGAETQIGTSAVLLHSATVVVVSGTVFPSTALPTPEMPLAAGESAL